MTRAAIYCRISDSRGEDATAGVDRQEADCRELAAQRGWDVTGIYVDNSRSAYKGTERPEWRQLRTDVLEGQVDAVVAWKDDRLWRSTLDQQLFLHDCGPRLERIAYVNGRDVDPSSANDKAMSTVEAVMAERSSADAALRVARKHRELAEQGRHGGGQRAFGHNADRSDVVPDEADAIREAVDRVLAGEPLGRIAQDWNDRGIRTPRGYSWNTTSLGRMLAQPRLAGLREFHGEVVGAADWPAIIDTATHRRLLAARESRQRGPLRNRARRHLLSGFLRCSKCGAPMSGSRFGNADRYRCMDKANGGCGGTVIVVDLADEALRKMVFTRLASPEFAEAVEQAREEATEADDALQEAVDHLESYRARLGELEDEWLEGDVSRAEYRRVRAKVRDRMTEAERVVDRLAFTPTSMVTPDADTLGEAWEAMDIDQRRTLLATVIEQVVVHPAVRPFQVFRPDRLEPIWKV